MSQTNRVRLSKEERRQQIIESAKAVFVDKGYAATTTATIAKQANVAEVTLFRYFDSKVDIFNAVIEPIIQRQTQLLPDDVVSMSKKEILESLLFDRITYLMANQGVIKLILNEAIITQQTNYIESMVHAMMQLMQQVDVLLDTPFARRVLMGSFLSFLYYPETKQERITNYIDDIVSLLMK